ncbi:MAG: hypothetical protein C0514_03460 [Candidatus Puniceispirillum sp.]|nr:hypothetical protein [Candidatus Puniceispirillum sp.]
MMNFLCMRLLLVSPQEVRGAVTIFHKRIKGMQMILGQDESRRGFVLIKLHSFFKGECKCLGQEHLEADEKDESPAHHGKRLMYIYAILLN